MQLRLLTILIISLLPGFSLMSQKIDYSVPEGFEKDISKENYKKIIEIAVPVIAGRYQIDYIKDGTIQLKKGQDITAFNLDNLILKCTAIKDTAAWKDVIRDHFVKMFSSFDEKKKIDPSNYESIMKYLSIRIYPKQTVEQRGGTSSLVTKTDLEDTYTLLMLDLPGAFSAVQKEMFTSWKKESSEVFKIAQENVNKQKIEKITKSFDVDRATIEVSFLGNEDYAASYALDLINNSPDLVGEWGSVVSIPNKGLVDICKITKERPVDFVKFIQVTKPMIEKLYKEHPQPVSNQYFWYYKGIFTRINVLTKDNGSIDVISPFGLTELMTKKN